MTDQAQDAPKYRPLADSVLRLIWEQREISRAEIARRAGLSRSTVSDIVSSLLPTGLVVEAGSGPSSGGRRPIVLQFQDQVLHILGVEMGAAHVAVVLTDLRCRVLHWEHRDHDVRSDPVGTRTIIAELCALVLSRVPQGPERLLGIGVGVPSPVDPADPRSLSEVVLPDWQGKTGLESLERTYDRPLMIDNDANLGALAERWWGAGHGVDNFAYVKVATGVGSGHVIDGEIYRGATGVAGEIGHMAIDPNGPPCICGLRGCLATFVGANALKDRARALLSEYPESNLQSEGLTISQIERAAMNGDALALQVVREAAQKLGIAVAGLLNLMNPSRVIFGGQLSELGELLLEPLRRTVQSRTLLSSVAASDILTSDLGPRSVAVGAATLILKTALADSRVFPTSAIASEVP